MSSTASPQRIDQEVATMKTFLSANPAIFRPLALMILLLNAADIGPIK